MCVFFFFFRRMFSKRAEEKNRIWEKGKLVVASFLSFRLFPSPLHRIFATIKFLWNLFLLNKKQQHLVRFDFRSIFSCTLYGFSISRLGTINNSQDLTWFLLVKAPCDIAFLGVSECNKAYYIIDDMEDICGMRWNGGGGGEKEQTIDRNVKINAVDAWPPLWHRKKIRSKVYYIQKKFCVVISTFAYSSSETQNFQRWLVKCRDSSQCVLYRFQQWKIKNNSKKKYSKYSTIHINFYVLFSLTSHN